jgi:hypothetical protein
MMDEAAVPDGLKDEAPDAEFTPEVEAALQQLAEMLIDAYLESKRSTLATK